MFSGKNIVVTGGTGALGRSTVAAFISYGGSVFVPSIDGNPYAGQKGVTVIEPVDLTNEESVTDFYYHVDRVDVVVNLAGGYLFAPLEQTDHEALMRQVNMNLATCYMSCRAAVNRMRHHRMGGAIVNISARAGMMPRLGAQMTAYTIAKAGVAALTEALAEELKGDGIRVNAVAPSIIDTDVNRMVMPDANYDEWVKPDDIAGVILSLCEDRAHGVSGTTAQVYGRV